VPGILLLCGLLLAGCASTSADRPPGSAEVLPTGLVGPVAPTPGPGALRYVALGDSYTYGDGVQQADRWTNQLVRILRPDLDLDIVANLSGRSTATQDLIQGQLPQLVDLRPEFVTVQVGVNDVIGEDPSPEMYSANIGTILDAVLAQGVPADRIVVVTTPDYTLTPMGATLYGPPELMSPLIREFNGLLTTAAAERGIAVVDISPISDRVSVDSSLVASDGLHPSGKQYAGWADLVAERIRQLFAAAQASSPASPESATKERPAGGPAGSVSP
jgi:acyl-CoA thioesterase-1